jgi:hypothetical protein
MDVFDLPPGPEFDAAVARELRELEYQLDMLSAGLAVRYAGLIYFLPLCHDAYGEGNG